MPADADCFHAVRAALAAAYGPLVHDEPGALACYVALGRIGVRVAVDAVGEDEAVIDLYAWIAQGVPVTGDLAVSMLKRNAALRFGALSIDPEGDVIYAHTLFSDGASPAVVERLVAVLAQTADVLDAELRA